jgi:uncharacterized membrane-anchored protein YitT (DUF2179 family)
MAAEFVFGFGFLAFFFFALMSLAGFVLPLVAAVHVLVRDDLEDLQRLVWLLVVVFIPFLWLVYFALGKERTANLFDDL